MFSWWYLTHCICSVLYSSVHDCIWSCLPQHRYVLILSLGSVQTCTWKYTDHLTLVFSWWFRTSWYSSILYSSVHGCIWSCLPKHRHVLILSLRLAQTCKWIYTDKFNIIVLMVIPNYLFGSVLYSFVHDWLYLLKHRHVLILSLRSAYTYTWKYTDHLNICIVLVIPN